MSADSWLRSCTRAAPLVFSLIFLTFDVTVLTTGFNTDMVHREMLINGHFIGGPCDQAVGKAVIRNPYNNQVVGSAAEGGWPEADAAIETSVKAFESWSHSARRDRRKLLLNIAAEVRKRADELAELLTDEVGKPITWSQGEVTRLALTFELAADILSSYGRESLPLDYDPRGDGYTCRVERFPIGPILCIVPYNWPFNLAAHKLAPALATGNTAILKPSNQAPLSTLTLARICHESGAPEGVVNAVVVPSAISEKMALDPRVKMLSFTGSPPVGWRLKGLLPEKRVSLELGGNASAIVCEDADLDWTVPRLVAGGYGYAGQICIAIQHVLAHESIYEDLRDRLTKGTRECATGDTRDPATLCGPLISSKAADKVQEWIDEAVKAGATMLAGGQREGNTLWPTLLEDVPDNVRMSCEEVFGPVLTLRKYRDFDEAIEIVNSSQFGIHCGVFTKDLARSEKAFQKLEVGGVIVNDYPTLRFDVMPYGGVKRSGFGREGVRYAMDEMTELKALVERRI